MGISAGVSEVPSILPESININKGGTNIRQ